MRAIKLLLLLLFVSGIVLFLSYEKIVSDVLLPQYIDWAYKIDKKGQQEGTALSADQLILATEIGIKHPEKVRLVYIDEIPFPRDNYALKVLGEALGFIGEGIVNNAQAFGYSIYIRNGYPLDTPKLAHELVHVLQIERSSLDSIIRQHISDLATYGYDNAPLEVEAFKANNAYKEE
ncbi:hypothetical protein HHX48_08040 [Salinimonas sp. HHU 13199]|uniref:DUF4157 domain-containing protein n=1 Tax=Salinimonas profundi TaxID=2729140 RepID=A0ABR8LNK6_9ALTE|nr:hypothetical protein [Salinimonas profundi]MBD3585680.1 hypothetical protein [Salinimonas profundi]